MLLWEVIFPEREWVEFLSQSLDGVSLAGQVSERPGTSSSWRRLRAASVVGNGPRVLIALLGHAEALDCVGGVNDLADLRRELEKRHDTPQLRCHSALIEGYFLSPLFTEVFQLLLRCFLGLRPVDRL
jgi:hypothetical protein